MGKQPENAHKQWTKADKGQLEQLAKKNTPTRVIGIKLERTPGSVQAEASKLGVSLKPTNQSPYNRQEKK